jgi:hypothetical protein
MRPERAGPHRFGCAGKVISSRENPSSSFFTVSHGLIATLKIRDVNLVAFLIADSWAQMALLVPVTHCPNRLAAFVVDVFK